MKKIEGKDFTMIKYRVFFIGYGGVIQDAFKNDILEYDISEIDIQAALNSLNYQKANFNIREDLQFVILACVE